MNKKTINIIYWITTGLILALMLFSAVGSFKETPEGTKMLEVLGYKPYVMHLLAVAKVLGVIAILTPGFPRLKEWAYAGFTFDLIGAAYSSYASGIAFKDWAPILVFLAVLACSYIFYHKRLKLKGSAA
ncbi:DoxX family protein [Mucilaginibacter psychrotolerans]|uniref:DoxX family protein n=1 Tax=Mucilaginibacter psychrotolerans TaxID=1524096 RepID=A0A4Y8SF61_9SPHI|nr:DoxX family protein [Mucilaginibacter psychrotolerans]TFF37542.1 DoxX family protein [Mucilaginibacter psychrotolerans]